MTDNVADDPQQVIADLQRRLDESIAQQTATADVLKVISRSTFDLQSVLETLIKSAVELSGANRGSIFLREGEVFPLKAASSTTPEFLQYWAANPPRAGRGSATSRVIASGKVEMIPDVLKDPDMEMPANSLIKIRAALGVPMLRDNQVEGVLVLTRPESGPFTKSQIDLVQTFADQAMIAIENARLFDEVQTKTADLQESLQHQIATSEVLKVISRSPGELRPVFEAVLENATRICDAGFGTLFRFDGNAFYFAADVGTPAALAEYMRRPGAFQGLSGGMIDRILRTRQVQHSPDYAADAAPGVAARLGGARSTLGVPILRDDVLVGAIVIYRQEVRPFSTREIDLVRSFAAQAAIAIENTRLFNETKEALERQTATADILKVIASSPSDVQPVFDAIATSSNRLIGGFSTAVLRFVDNELHLVAFTPTNPTADEALKSSFPRPVEEFPPFMLVRDGVTQQITDTESEGVSPLLRDLARLRGYRSMLFTPLMNQGKPIGIISVTRKELGTFAQHHIQLVRTFADQAVIAIENVRLFDEVEARTEDLRESLQQQTATADVLKVISRSVFDLQTVLDTLVESAYKLCGANVGLLYLRGDEAFECKAIAGVGVTEASRLFKGRPIRAGRGTAAERVILTGEVQSITNFYEDPEMDPRIREAIRNANGSDSSIGQIRSTLAVPMTRDNAVIGVMVIGCSQTGSFPQRQIELLQTFADQAVIAIENARLFDEVQAKTADLSESLQHQTATSEVLKVISRSPGELDPVFRTILSSATSICDAQFGLLVLYEGGGFRCASMFNLPPAFAETFSRNPVIYPPPIDPLGRLIATQQLVHVVDVKQEPAYLTDFPPIVELVELGGARTLLLVPMLKENNLVGVIAIFRQTVHAFSDKQIDLVTSFGSQAVIAIENARLLNELRERTDDLTESLQQQTATADVLKVISRSAFDLKSVLTTLTESAKSLCGASLGIICLRDGEVMRLQAESGCTQAFVDFMHAHPIKPGRETITGRVFMDGKPVHVADVELDPEYSFANAPTIGAYRAVLAVPLMRDAAVEGVLLLGRPGPGPFSQRQLDLVQTFADQAVIAIENVRLFEQVQERTKELSLSLDELRTAQDRLVQTEKLASLGQLTAGIAHEIKNPLNFVNNFSALSGELIDELNELLGLATLDDKAREEIDELTNMLKGNLEKVVQHGKRADSIVKNMLLHSREGSGEHRPADINAIVEESLNLAYHGARAEKPAFNITLKRDLDPAAGLIDLYPQEITRVFLNLISNGFYAATKRKEAGDAGFEPTLSATTKNIGNRVEIRIRDNGTGIPAEVKEKMFNPFFTTKPAGEGTGLGLSMSHDIIVKQHGGKIDVETEPGAFTEFIITLPRAAAQTQAGGRN